MGRSMTFAACAILLAAPAAAQVSGGVGGSIGGAVGGTVGGTVGGVGGNAGGSIGGSAGGLAGGTLDSLSNNFNTNLNGSISTSLDTSANLDAGDRSAQFHAGNVTVLNASTAASVQPGMTVRDLRGRAVGTVQGVRTTARGAVNAVLIRVGSLVAAVPPASLGISGDVVVSALGRAELRREAQHQEARRQDNGEQTAQAEPRRREGRSDTQVP